MNLHQEIDPTEGCPIGRDPRTLQRLELEGMGHLPSPPLKVIRAKCKECSMGSEAEVRRCGMVSCPLWPYRMGTNPLRAEKTEAQMEAAKKAGERMRKARAA